MSCLLDSNERVSKFSRELYLVAYRIPARVFGNEAVTNLAKFLLI
ncbi:MAG: hypothetical protein ACI9ZF_003057 [Bradyrhizobium sp.]|jgi:hypothetical protein